MSLTKVELMSPPVFGRVGAVKAGEGITVSADGTTGGVSQINTANGISGGPITSTGTIGIATGGIVDSMVSDVAGIDAIKSQYTAAYAAAVSRTVKAKLNDTLSLKDFGAVGNGVADDKQALLAAFNALNAQGGGTLYIPPGTYRIVSSAPSLILTGNTFIYGAGSEVSILKYDESASSTRRDFIIMGTGSAASANISLVDFGIIGSWGDSGDYTQKSQMLSLNTTGNIYLSGMHLSKSTYFSAAIGNAFGTPSPCNSVIAIGNRVDNCPGDGISIRGCKQAIVIGNFFQNVNDDTVAFHTLDDQTSPVQSYAVISNNNIMDSQGIACLGAQHTVVTSNTITRATYRGIMVQGPGSSGFPEGNNANFSINISNNVVDTVFYGSAFSNISAAGCTYITITPGSLSTVGGGYPGGPNGSGGIVSPYPYFYKNNAPASNPAVGAYSVSISNNVCMRSLNPTAKYSDYGFGVRMGRSGPADPQITATQMGLAGGSSNPHFLILGACSSCRLSNNISYGAGYCVYVEGITTASISLNDFKIDGNIFSNFVTTGILLNGKGEVEITDNLFDGDPLFLSPHRGVNGTWAASGANTVSAIWQNAVSVGILFNNNTIKNVYQTYIGTDPDLISARNNTLYADPVSVSSPSNKGIASFGIPIAGNVNQLIVWDCNPSSATYGTIKNVCLAASAAKPTSGLYLTGQFVANATPVITGTAGSRYTVQGWSRITNGSGHTLNTDWVEVRALTGA